MLVDVSVRSQEITLFGNKQKMPIAIAPTGTAGLMWYHGEIELAGQRIEVPEGSKRLLVFVALQSGRVERRYAAAK